MRLVVGLLLAGVILALPRMSVAQEATLSGIITDSTGGVLPGVTVNSTITTQESNPQFGLPTSGENRTAQLGFRLTF